MDTNNKLYDFLKYLEQKEISGGINTPPEARLFLVSLALMIGAKRILETGYDAGYTTRALSLIGEKVIGVDDGSQYPDVKKIADEISTGFENMELVKGDAISFFLRQKDNSFDFIFIDDNHNANHVQKEAIQITRILRPGGVVVFHDTKFNSHMLGKIMETLGDWDHISIPSISRWQGGETHKVHEDYGMTVFVKPL